MKVSYGVKEFHALDASGMSTMMSTCLAQRHAFSLYWPNCNLFITLSFHSFVVWQSHQEIAWGIQLTKCNLCPAGRNRANFTSIAFKLVYLLLTWFSIPQKVHIEEIHKQFHILPLANAHVQINRVIEYWYVMNKYTLPCWIVPQRYYVVGPVLEFPP